MTRTVWDASALLLVLHQEPGWEGLAPRIGTAVVSCVNVAEVASKLTDAGIPAAEVEDLLGGLGLEIRPFDLPEAYEVSRLRRLTRSKGLSLGDRACLALARRLGLGVLTADRSWEGLRLGFAIELAR
ncbi:MAG: type II toxin-antitoxin system VapC family toxin [Acidobacteria bacterium]|nr:type II toxin-antitoxin system VapC family toxin [Acidobacteriota bacterium]